MYNSTDDVETFNQGIDEIMSDLSAVYDKLDVLLDHCSGVSPRIVSYWTAVYRKLEDIILMIS